MKQKQTQKHREPAGGCQAGGWEGGSGEEWSEEWRLGLADAHIITSNR